MAEVVEGSFTKELAMLAARIHSSEPSKKVSGVKSDRDIAVLSATGNGFTPRGARLGMAVRCCTLVAAILLGSAISLHAMAEDGPMCSGSSEQEQLALLQEQFNLLRADLRSYAGQVNDLTNEIRELKDSCFSTDGNDESTRCRIEEKEQQRTVTISCASSVIKEIVSCTKAISALGLDASLDASCTADMLSVDNACGSFSW